MLDKSYLVMEEKPGISYRKSQGVAKVQFPNNFLNDIPKEHTILIWASIIKALQYSPFRHVAKRVEVKAEPVRKTGLKVYLFHFADAYENPIPEIVECMVSPKDEMGKGWLVSRITDEKRGETQLMLYDQSCPLDVDGMVAGAAPLLDLVAFLGYRKQGVFFLPEGSFEDKAAMTENQINGKALGLWNNNNGYLDDAIDVHIMGDQISFIMEDKAVDYFRKTVWKGIEMRRQTHRDLLAKHPNLFGEAMGDYNPGYEIFTPHPNLTLDDVHSIHLAVYNAKR